MSPADRCHVQPRSCAPPGVRPHPPGRYPGMARTVEAPGKVQALSGGARSEGGGDLVDRSPPPLLGTAPYLFSWSCL